MRSHARTVLLVVVTWAVPVIPGLYGQEINRPSLSNSLDELFVNLAAADRPPANTLEDRERWAVVVREPEDLVGEPVEIDRVEPQPDYAISGQVAIYFLAPLGERPTTLDIVLFEDAGRTVVTSAVTLEAPKESSNTLGFFAVDKRDKADVFLSGSLVAGRGAKPLYNLDVELGAPAVEWDFWQVSVQGKAATSDSPNYDLDSFSVVGRLDRRFPFNTDGVAPYINMDWDMVRWEFSRKDVAYNLISAPRLLWSTVLAQRFTSTGQTVAAVNLRLVVGFEAGRNLRNSVTEEAYGGIFRGLGGAEIYAAFPGALGLAEIRWTSKYAARVLATREAFIDTRDEDHMSLARGTRHNLSNELKFGVTEFIGLTVKHDVGSAPPAFKILDHRATVGIEIKWAWRDD